MHVFLEALAVHQTPLVVAVNGLAIGVGATLLLHADLVYAADEASFAMPFANLGLVPEAASSMLLPRRVGRARAAEILLLGERFTAQEALNLGLVSRIFSASELRTEAMARARALTQKSPTAIRETLALIRGDTSEVLARMAEEGALFSRLLDTDEFREAATAFFEKRAPDFGRFR